MGPHFLPNLCDWQIKVGSIFSKFHRITLRFLPNRGRVTNCYSNVTLILKTAGLFLHHLVKFLSYAIIPLPLFPMVIWKQLKMLHVLLIVYFMLFFHAFNPFSEKQKSHELYLEIFYLSIYQNWPNCLAWKYP